VIVDRLESFDGLRESWHDLLDDHCNATVFQTHEWLSTWWKYFGDDRRLCLLTAREDSRLLGIAPLMIGRIRAAGVPWLKVMRFVGHDTTDYQDFILRDGHEEAVMRAFLGHLNTMKREWHVIVMGEVPETSPVNRWIGKTAESEGLAVHSEPFTPCPYIDLPASWDEYLAGLSSNARGNIRRKPRKLARLGTLDVETAPSAGDMCAAMDRFLVLHDDRMQSKGSDRPSEHAKRFHREVATELADHVALSFLRLDGKDVAGMYSFDFRGGRYYYLIGWDGSRENLSPGSVLIAKQIEGAISKGLHTFDFLRGDESYKYHFTSTQMVNRRHFVFRSPASRCVFRLLQRLRRR